MDRQHQGMDREREILEGMVEGERGRERPRATWTDNIKAWTGKGDIGGNGGG